jgi:hypothetical protein
LPLDPDAAEMSGAEADHVSSSFSDDVKKLWRDWRKEPVPVSGVEWFKRAAGIGALLSVSSGETSPNLDKLWKVIALAHRTSSERERRESLRPSELDDPQEEFVSVLKGAKSRQDIARLFPILLQILSVEEKADPAEKEKKEYAIRAAYELLITPRERNRMGHTFLKDHNIFDERYAKLPDLNDIGGSVGDASRSSILTAMHTADRSFLSAVGVAAAVLKTAHGQGGSLLDNCIQELVTYLWQPGNIGLYRGDKRLWPRQVSIDIRSTMEALADADITWWANRLVELTGPKFYRSGGSFLQGAVVDADLLEGSEVERLSAEETGMDDIEDDGDEFAGFWEHLRIFVRRNPGCTGIAMSILCVREMARSRKPNAGSAALRLWQQSLACALNSDAVYQQSLPAVLEYIKLYSPPSVLQKEVAAQLKSAREKDVASLTGLGQMPIPDSTTLSVQEIILRLKDGNLTSGDIFIAIPLIAFLVRETHHQNAVGHILCLTVIYELLLDKDERFRRRLGKARSLRVDGMLAEMSTAEVKATATSAEAQAEPGYSYLLQCILYTRRFACDFASKIQRMVIFMVEGSGGISSEYRSCLEAIATALSFGAYRVFYQNFLARKEPPDLRYEKGSLVTEVAEYIERVSGDWNFEFWTARLECLIKGDYSAKDDPLQVRFEAVAEAARGKVVTESEEGDIEDWDGTVLYPELDDEWREFEQVSKGLCDPVFQSTQLSWLQPGLKGIVLMCVYFFDRAISSVLTRGTQDDADEPTVVEEIDACHFGIRQVLQCVTGRDITIEELKAMRATGATLSGTYQQNKETRRKAKVKEKLEAYARKVAEENSARWSHALEIKKAAVEAAENQVLLLSQRLATVGSNGSQEARDTEEKIRKSTEEAGAARQAERDAYARLSNNQALLNELQAKADAASSQASAARVAAEESAKQLAVVEGARIEAEAEKERLSRLLTAQSAGSATTDLAREEVIEQARREAAEAKEKASSLERELTEAQSRRVANADVEAKASIETLKEQVKMLTSQLALKSFDASSARLLLEHQPKTMDLEQGLARVKRGDGVPSEVRAQWTRLVSGEVEMMEAHFEKCQVLLGRLIVTVRQITAQSPPSAGSPLYQLLAECEKSIPNGRQLIEHLRAAVEMDDEEAVRSCVIQLCSIDGANAESYRSKIETPQLQPMRVCLSLGDIVLRLARPGDTRERCTQVLDHLLSQLRGTNVERLVKAVRTHSVAQGAVDQESVDMLDGAIHVRAANNVDSVIASFPVRDLTLDYIELLKSKEKQVMELSKRVSDMAKRDGASTAAMDALSAKLLEKNQDLEAKLVDMRAKSEQRVKALLERQEALTAASVAGMEAGKLSREEDTVKHRQKIAEIEAKIQDKLLEQQKKSDASVEALQRKHEAALLKITKD